MPGKKLPMNDSQLKKFEAGKKQFRARHGPDGHFIWKEVLYYSGLESEGFTKEHLSQKQRNINKKKPEPHAEVTGRQGSTPNVHRNPNASFTESEDWDSDNGPTTASVSLDHRDLDRLMIADIEMVSKVVSGPVLVSKALWTYLGGARLMSHAHFKKLAEPFKAPLRLSFAGTMMPIPFAMQTLEAQFGKVFNRKPAMDADGLQSEPLRTGSSTLLNATEACAEGLVEEDVLAVNNTTNSEDELHFEVTTEVNQLITNDKRSDDVSVAPKETRRLTDVPLYATPKRPRSNLLLTPSVPLRDPRVDPISGASKYGWLHRLRLVDDSDWMKVLRDDDKRYPRLITKDANDWKNLMNKLRIPTAREGDEIKGEFYARVLPRIRKEFGEVGENIVIRLSLPDRYAMTTIYHAVEAKTSDGIRKAVRDLIAEEILDDKISKTPIQDWIREFSVCLVTENAAFFHASEDGFKTLKKLVLTLK